MPPLLDDTGQGHTRGFTSLPSCCSHPYHSLLAYFLEMMFGTCAHGDHAAGHDDVPVLRAIDAARVSCLNEAVAGSCRGVLRTHCTAADKSVWVQSASSDDTELLLHVPFTGPVRLRSLCVVGASGEAATACPARVRVFVNREGIDCDEARDEAPAAEFLLASANADGAAWLSLRAARFNNATSVQMFFPSGVLGGGGAARIYFVGLKGEPTGARREAVHATYEARAQLADHPGVSDVAGAGFNART